MKDTVIKTRAVGMTEKPLPGEQQVNALIERRFLPWQAIAVQQTREAKKQQPAKYKFEVYITLLNMLIASHFLFECNEDLSNTTAYKHKLKQIVKQLQPELTKLIDEDLGLLMGSDENAQVLFNMQDGFKGYFEALSVHKMIKHTPAAIGGLGELIKKFHMMPEWVLHHNGIKIYETEKES